MIGSAPLWVAGLVCAGLFAFAVAGLERLRRRRFAVIADRICQLASGLSGPRAAADAPPTPVERALASLAAALDLRDRLHAQTQEVLRSVVEDAPSSTLIMKANGEVAFANAAARALFFDGRDLVGKNFLGMVERAPEVLKRAMIGAGDELLSVEDEDGEPRTFHLSKRNLTLDGEASVLVTVGDVTRELARREIDVWKQVIRVIAHEIGNSLAPISTLAATGVVLAAGAPEEPKLLQIFDAIKERAIHLRDFLDSYARVARLPQPRRRDVALAELGRRMATLCDGIRVVVSADAEPGWLDQAQIEQLVLNLVQNARESGSPREAIALSIDGGDPRFVRLSVTDRGHGMAPDVMKRALLPLFSTKSTGSGLGLALCREIAEAHDGTIRLRARDGGGLEVVVKLPRRPADGLRGPSPLTLTRGQ
jgi:nitrogen fixation/metabolism regulation signal transduction histidine kinase